MRFRLLLVHGLLPGLLAACVSESRPEPQPDFELETERVILHGYGHGEGELCGGTAQWIDDSINALAPWFDLEPGRLGVYNWYSDDSWAAIDPCGEALGCVWFPSGVPTAHSTFMPFDHEIAHMAGATCVDVLAEGLAEYLRGAGPTPRVGLEGVDLEHALAASFEEGDWDLADYQRSRHFTSYLAYEYGLDSVIALCDVSPKNETTRAEFDQSAQDILGVSLDQLLVDYASYPECPEERDRAKLLECGRTPTIELEVDANESIHLDASCAHPNAVGPRGDFFHLAYTIRLVGDGDFSFSSSSTPQAQEGVVFRFEQCASCGEGAAGILREWDSNYIDFGEWYAAGIYVLDVQIPLDFDSELWIHLSR